ncbi:MAG TPA: hypothetical protein PKJ63_03100 [Cyclobacteriaceae bacterium]|nr:hypothetical protein [Cyclobacteriaceae bacterium]
MQLKGFFLTIILLFVFSQTRVSAQPQLALLKKDRVITRFEEGESIRFKKKGDDGYSVALIQGIHPGFIIVADDTVYTYEIDVVDVRKKKLTTFKVSSIGKGLMVAGAGLFLVDLFNTTVIINSDYRIKDSAWRGSAVLFGLGTFMQFVNNDFFRQHRHRRIATVNFRPS